MLLAEHYGVLPGDRLMIGHILGLIGGAWVCFRIMQRPETHLGQHLVSNIMHTQRCNVSEETNRINAIERQESSPEKAGIGGSIPSLATI